MAELNRELVAECVELQDKFNTSVRGGDWREQDLDWMMAIIVECGELMGHLGYKWWKKQTSDKKEAFVEIIDIVHFLISDNLKLHTSARLVNIIIAASLGIHPKTSTDDTELVKRISYYVKGIIFAMPNTMDKGHVPGRYASINLVWANLFNIATTLGYTDLNSVFKMYLAKNALNKLRQDKGYKSGEYKKMWNGKEDNTYLHGLTGTTFNQVYSELEKIYENSTKV